MTTTPPERAVRAFERRDGFEHRDGRFVAVDNHFDVTVNASETDGSEIVYRFRMAVPTLSAATHEAVAPALETGWFETFELRIEDASMALVRDVSIEAPTARIEGEQVVVETAFEEPAPEHAPEIAGTLADYVEGTYAEGVVPGFEYRPPVSDLLASARRSGDSEGGPMPM